MYTYVFFFSICIRPVLSSSKALGLTAQSLHQCSAGHGENLDLCLEVTLVHGSAMGTAMPKQPKINLLHI